LKTQRTGYNWVMNEQNFESSSTRPEKQNFETVLNEISIIVAKAGRMMEEYPAVEVQTRLQTAADRGLMDEMESVDGLTRAYEKTLYAENLNVALQKKL